MWRYVHNLACFTLEQIRRKLNTVIKNIPYGTLQISKLYTLLGLQKAFKKFLGCFLAWYEMFTITWQRLLLQLEDQLVSLRVFILGLWLYLVWRVRFKTRIQLCNNTTHELVYLYFFFTPLSSTRFLCASHNIKLLIRITVYPIFASGIPHPPPTYWETYDTDSHSFYLFFLTAGTRTNNF